MRYTILLFVFFLTCNIAFVSGQSTGNMIEKKIGHVYYLSVPDYMIKTFDLNDNASCQYYSEDKDVYVIVIEDSKADLENMGMKYTSPRHFYDDFMFDWKNDSTLFSNEIEFKIQSNEAFQAEILRNVEGNEITYLITIIETPEYFYKIIEWTSQTNRDFMIEDFKKIVNSFHE